MKSTHTLSSISSAANILLAVVKNEKVSPISDKTTKDILYSIDDMSTKLALQIAADLENVKTLIRNGDTELAIGIIDNLLY